MKITRWVPLVMAATLPHSALAAEAEPGHLPKVKAFGATKTLHLMDADELQSFKALKSYHEPSLTPCL